MKFTWSISIPTLLITLLFPIGVQSVILYDASMSMLVQIEANLSRAIRLLFFNDKNPLTKFSGDHLFSKAPSINETASSRRLIVDLWLGRSSIFDSETLASRKMDSSFFFWGIFLGILCESVDSFRIVAAFWGIRIECFLFRNLDESVPGKIKEEGEKTRFQIDKIVSCPRFPVFAGMIRILLRYKSNINDPRISQLMNVCFCRRRRLILLIQVFYTHWINCKELRIVNSRLVTMSQCNTTTKPFLSLKRNLPRIA